MPAARRVDRLRRRALRALLSVAVAAVFASLRVAGLLWMDRDEPTRPSPPPVLAVDLRPSDASDVEGSAIRAGDCWDESSGLAVTDHARAQQVAEVSCVGPHRGETILVLRLPDAPGVPFPGEQRLHDELLPRCVVAFERYVGVPYERSDLELVIHQPSATTWTRSGDREAMCSVRNGDGTPMAFSVRDGGR